MDLILLDPGVLHRRSMTMDTAIEMKAKKKKVRHDEEAINVKLTDEQVDRLLRPEKYQKERIVVASAGPVSFDVSPMDLLSKRIKVTVLLASIPVGDVILDQDHTETSIGPNVGLAKAFITLSLNWERQNLTYTAKACVRNWRLKWVCADYRGTLATW